MEEKLDKLFHLKERGTTVRTEVLAGLTTFVTAAYALVVNPSVMSATGMDSGAVFTATALVCFLGMLIMALLTNYPFVLVPSMGLNAYFSYTVVLGNSATCCSVECAAGIDFGDPTESIPAFLCFVGMPFCYSIVEGISMGIISYVGINLLCGNHKKVSPMMYVLAVVFILKYVLI